MITTNFGITKKRKEQENSQTQEVKDERVEAMKRRLKKMQQQVTTEDK
jgi:hypothetical protein